MVSEGDTLVSAGDIIGQGAGIRLTAGGSPSSIQKQINGVHGKTVPRGSVRLESVPGAGLHIGPG
mgnify:CR=1 FL=1